MLDQTGRMGAAGRREIGHGKLAERALAPVVPEAEHFAYTIRLESTITESNGSSSMASVCGGCLAMLDAGKGPSHFTCTLLPLQRRQSLPFPGFWVCALIRLFSTDQAQQTTMGQEIAVLVRSSDLAIASLHKVRL